MEILFALIAIVVGVLQIILFFKLWGMTNDVREIKETYLSGKNNSQSEVSQSNTNVKHSYNLDIDDATIAENDKSMTPQIGTIVRRKSDKVYMKIERDLGNSLYLCVNPETGVAIASYKRFDFEVVSN